VSVQRSAPGYPVTLVVDGRPCLVVGGGRVAARKVEGLRESGAQVHVLAPAVDASLKAAEGVTWEERPYQSGDAAGYRLVVAATDDRGVNGDVAADAERHGVWVNSADDPERCTFTLPSVVRRGPLLVSVSTSDRSPAVARWLRERLDQELDRSTRRCWISWHRSATRCRLPAGRPKTSTGGRPSTRTCSI
jgi:siroheme synthase-like protein